MFPNKIAHRILFDPVNHNYKNNYNNIIISDPHQQQEQNKN